MGAQTVSHHGTWERCYEVPRRFATAALLAAPVLSAPCRDAKGKFTKCPPAAAAAAASVKKDAKGRCHGAGGKYIACPK